MVRDIEREKRKEGMRGIVGKRKHVCEIWRQKEIMIGKSRKGKGKREKEEREGERKMEGCGKN